MGGAGVNRAAKRLQVKNLRQPVGGGANNMRDQGVRKAGGLGGMGMKSAASGRSGDPFMSGGSGLDMRGGGADFGASSVAAGGNSFEVYESGSEKGKKANKMVEDDDDDEGSTNEAAGGSPSVLGGEKKKRKAKKKGKKR